MKSNNLRYTLIKNSEVVFSGASKECAQYLEMKDITFRMNAERYGYVKGYKVEKLRKSYIVKENGIEICRARTIQSLSERLGYHMSYLLRRHASTGTFGTHNEFTFEEVFEEVF